MRKLAPPPAPLPVTFRSSAPAKIKVIVGRSTVELPSKTEPVPLIVERIKIDVPEPAYLPYEPLLLPMKNVLRLRYFWSENAARPVPFKGKLLNFTKTALVGGVWQGYYITEIPEHAAAMVAFCAGNKAFREVTASEFELLTGLKQEGHWKLQDFMGSVPIIEVPAPPVRRKGPKIIHCVQRWKHRTEEWDRRIGQARETWVALYKTGDVVPCHYWDYKRSSLDLGDKRCLPYLKDILTAGLERSGHEDDIIMLTNDDSVLHPRTAEIVVEHLKRYPVCCSGRISFNEGEFPDFTSSLAPVSGWEKDIGRDLFAMRKKWLKKKWNEIPDVLVADIEWDLALSALFRKEVKVKPTIKGRLVHDPKSEIPPGYVFHERHGSEWNKPYHEETPARLFCRKVMREWYRAQKMDWMITI